MKTKFYLGCKNKTREVFKSDIIPTNKSHGHIYNAVIGTFITKRGANFMKNCGDNNPHIQNVNDAERLSKNL